MLEGYIYYPDYRSICDEYCLGFVNHSSPPSPGRGVSVTKPCENCKDYTGFTQSDRAVIFSGRSYDQFVISAKHYQLGIDLKKKCLVDMDRVVHEHYIKQEKANKEKASKMVPLSVVPLHTSIKHLSVIDVEPKPDSISYEEAAAVVGPQNDVKNCHEQDPGKKKGLVATNKAKPEKIDFREIALGGLFKNSEERSGAE